MRGYDIKESYIMQFYTNNFQSIIIYINYLKYEKIFHENNISYLLKYGLKTSLTLLMIYNRYINVKMKEKCLQNLNEENSNNEL